jgi:hypothetical protein
MSDPQVYGLLGAVLLLHLGTLAYVYLRRSRAADPAGGDPETVAERLRPEAESELGPDEEGRLTCPQCGARNDPSYRFCRICVADLPGSAGHGEPGGFSNAA